MNKAKVVMGEFMLAEPAFRTNSRMIAIKDDGGQVRFALEYQHDGEPGAWLPELSFPWHADNFDSVICAAAEFHEKIMGVINYREQKAREELEDV